MSQALKQYYSQIRQKLAFLEQRPDELTRAAEIMSHSIMGQRNIFVFGASHAGILAEEMSYRVLVEQSPLRAEDTLLIHSVSGRNAITIDVALAAKACGATVIAITSLATAARVTSRHSSGKLLVDVADITIDNHCEYGDAAVSLPGMAQKAAPLSTIMGAAIANSLVLRICEIMLENARTPPILASANIDGNQEINQDILSAYRSQIHYL